MLMGRLLQVLRQCSRAILVDLLRVESLRQSMDLIDFAWDDPEMHCGSVRQIGSVACVKSWQQRVHKDYSIRQTR